MPALALPFSFYSPAWMWLCALIPVLVLVSFRSMAGLGPGRRIAAIIVRAVLIALIAACLAEVSYVKRHDDLTVMFLMDRSHSARDHEQFQDAFIRKVSEDIAKDDRTGVIDFARNAFLEQLPMRGGYLIPDGRLPIMSDTDRTNIAEALRLAMVMFPHDTTKRIVLFSDGNDNMGDVMTEAGRAAADGIPVDIVPLWYRHRNEIHIERMLAPTYAEAGERVQVRLVVSSERAASGTLAIYHNDNLLQAADGGMHVDLEPGPNTFMFDVFASGSGTQRYRAVFTPDRPSDDTVAANNEASAFTFLSGGSQALLITTDPQIDAPLFDALQSERLDVVMRHINELEEFDLLAMMEYSTVILANVPAEKFSEQQIQDLATYVKDMGSGLIMLGGDESFGAGGWIGTPVEEVMPVSFEIKHKRVIPRGALVLIMHSCEIPKGNFWGKEMSKKSVDTISSQDYIGVLTYSWSPGGNNWDVPLQLATNKAAIKSKIDQLQIGDMPDFDSTLRMAFKALTGGIGRDAAQKHIIILSDGDASPPSQKLLQQLKAAKITVSTIGIGWGSHVMSSNMIKVANATGGKYYAAQNPKALPQIFVKESKVVRRPLIVEQAFEPRIVLAYSDLLAGIDTQLRLPPLNGMVLTSSKDSPYAQVPIVRQTNDGDDPVLAYWQVELGKAVAFTSGYWSYWGNQWTGWPRFARLWAQIVRWTLRQETPANFDTRIHLEGNKARIVVDALDKNANYLNFLQFRTKVIGPDNESIPIRLMQTGPGMYEAELEVDKSGQYLANLHVFEGEQRRGTIRTGFTIPFSPEYRVLSTNESMLRRIAEITGGRWIDPNSPQTPDIYSHDLPPVEARSPVWDWVLAWLILPLFLMDVSVRRLANWLVLSIVFEIVLAAVVLVGCGVIYTDPWTVLFWLGIVHLLGWAVRWQYIGPAFSFMTHGVTAMSGTGERSEASLESLKGAKDRAREDIEEQRGEGLRSIAQEVGNVDRAVSGRRFDVGDKEAKQDAGDIHEALGSAKSAKDYEEKRRPPASAKESGGEESATSRLLRAKKRAQKDIDDQSED